MARLLIEARTAEWTSGDVAYTLLIGVSVSRADDGTSVTGLTKENFRVASHIGLVKDFKVGAVYEWNWEPNDVQAAGCYQVEVIMTPAEEFSKGARYVFGIQVRTLGVGKPPKVIDTGQTMVELISVGQ